MVPTMPVAKTSRTTRKRVAPRAKPLLKGPLPAKLPGISRIDHRRTHGYFIRLGYQTTKTGVRARFVSFFGDVSYGGKRKALTAAKAWVTHVLLTGRAPKDKPSR